ncbi:hypothetical protein B484DRAFT_396182 [Ochromonadaceae sp. CCMP2298]|nr:hypothetical protein B484DRAFT_396182 [Ochromonadaceae sp. CCMP2298]
MCLLTPFAFDGLVGLLLGFVFAVATLAVCIVGVVWDFVTFDYFDDLSKNCPGIENECFCDATEKEFQRDFGALADFNCNNPATRNDGILVANFVFSFLCALQALVFCLALLGAVGKYVVCSRCFESTPPTRAANTAV